MNTKKFMVFGFVILLLFVNTISVSCRRDNMHSIKSSLTLSEVIKNGNLSDLNLTIYYLNPFIVTRVPIRIDDLVNRRFEHKIVVSGDCLEEHIDLLNSIINANLIPLKVTDISSLHARIYPNFGSCLIKNAPQTLVREGIGALEF